MIKHFRRWNIWRKKNLNSRLHKFFALIGFIRPQTLILTWLPEEEEEYYKVIDECFRSKEYYEEVKE